MPIKLPISSLPKKHSKRIPSRQCHSLAKGRGEILGWSYECILQNFATKNQCQSQI